MVSHPSHLIQTGEVQGDIVELGVWRGGAMIMAAILLQEAKSDRKLFLFDAFGKRACERVSERVSE